MRKLKPGRRPEISDVALRIADERGLDALSMHAVAKGIGLTTMALYGYFRSKDDLLDSVVGRVLDEVPKPPADLHWRDRLRLLARGARAVARDHPSVFPLLFTRPAVTPDAIRVVEPIYQALLDAGVPDAQVPRLERLLSTVVLGFSVSEVGGRFAHGTLAPRERREQLPPEQLPAHDRLAATLDAASDWDAEFEADLEDLIAMIDRHAKT